MEEMKPHQRVAGRLRWKLTLSYAGVTLGVSLVIGLMFVIASAGAFRTLMRNGSLAVEMIELTSAQFTPQLRPYLSQTPPDVGGVENWLASFADASVPVAIIDDGVPVVISEDEMDLLVVGSDGRVLAATRPGLPDVSGELVAAALVGESDAGQLYRLDEAGDSLVMAVPVWDAAEERVLGALVMVAPIPPMGPRIVDSLGGLAIGLVIIAIAAAIIGTLFGFVAARGLVRRFDRLSGAALAWSRGDFGVLVDDTSADEVGHLARHLNDMARQLQHLLDTRRELAVVEERNRLARDLHDSVKQQAFAAAAQLDAAQALLARDPQAAAANVTEAVQLVDSLREELTGLIEELRPPALQGKGLAPALREVAADWSRQSGIVAEVRVKGERRLALEVEQTVFRVAQEALSNVARHSAASRVEIGLVYEAGTVSLSVADDGRGFEIGDNSTGLGLRSMRERVEAVAGSLIIDSTPGEGTRVTCEFILNTMKGGGADG